MSRELNHEMLSTRSTTVSLRRQVPRLELGVGATLVHWALGQSVSGLICDWD